MPLQTPKPLNFIISAFILVITGIIINLFLYHRYGPILTYDSHQFISYAEDIAKGHLYNERYVWYFSYAAFLAFMNFISFGIESVVFVQVLIFLISVIGLYYLVFNHTSNHWMSLLVSLVYVLFFKIAQRNLYILTESIFTGLIIGLMILLSRMENKPLTLRNSLLLLTLLAFATFMRPNGILLIASIAFSLILFIERPITKWTLLVGFIVAGFFLLDRLIISLDILSEYQRGVMVYNADQVDPEVYSVSGLLMDTAGLKSISGEGTMGLLEFIFKNPAYFIEGFFKKVFYLLFHIRPYYSLGHNLFILAFLLPIYGLSIYGWMKSKRSILSVCSLLFVLLNITTVGVTWCVWEGRFLFPLLPIFFLYAGVGLKSLNVILRLRSV